MARTLRILKSTLLALCLIAPSAFAQAQDPVYIQLILDASGSMWNKLEDGRYRIVAAKEVLSQLIAALPERDDLNVGLRVYGANKWASDPGACEDTHLVVPMRGVDREAMLRTVRETDALGATPIALSLELAAQDFPSEGRKVIVLITDGIESCRTDLREVAERLKAQGVEVDLRIIGIDLDANARAAFEGLGAFENATSAAELLGALNRAVEVAPAPAKHRVTVALTRDGVPAVEGAYVEFVGTVDGEAHVFGPGNGAGELVAELPAGVYTARVRDAYSPEPLVVGGLTVTEHGNAFAFELAPEAEVALTLSDASPAAGSTVTVSFEGAPAGLGEVRLAEAGSDDAYYLSYEGVQGPAGEASLRVPDRPGEYEVRYALPLPEGGYKVIGRAALSAQAVIATLTVPAEAVAGSQVPVSWEGPGNRDDYVTIVPVGAEEGRFGPWAYVSGSEALSLRAPEQPGEYEVRYVTGQSGVTIGTARLVVTAASATVSAPAEVAAGAFFEVAWTGPDNRDDYITIVPAGTPEGEWGDYQYTSHGNPAQVRAPGEPGEYEVRYVTGGDDITLATTTVTVTAVTASVSAPRSVVAGADVEVHWTGPDNRDDYVTIVPAGSPEGTWDRYAYTSEGNPIYLRAPDRPGEYEVRYVAGVDDSTLARVPLTLEPATATVSGPSSASVDETIEIHWTGPANSGDYITVVPVGSEDSAWGVATAYATDGDPAVVTLYVDPGEYEIRYVTGWDNIVLARQRLTVR